MKLKQVIKRRKAAKHIGRHVVIRAGGVALSGTLIAVKPGSCDALCTIETALGVVTFPYSVIEFNHA